MKYAIIKTGGKQIKAIAGESIIVEKLNVEGAHEIHEVLAVYDGKKLHIGKPLVKGAVLKTTVQKQGKGKKIKILRTKAKSNWARHQGHRQPYTRLFVDEIIMDGKSVDKAKATANAQTTKKESSKEDK